MDNIKNLLGAFHRKRRDKHFSPVFKGCGENVAKPLPRVRVHLMFAPAVGAFHDDRVDVGRVCRITKQIVMPASNIAGKKEPFFFSGFMVMQIQNHLGGTQNVPGINKCDLHAVANRHGPVVIESYKLPETLFRINRCIQRRVGRLPLAGAFFVGVFHVGCLNFGRIRQHDLAKIAGRRRGINISPVSLAGQVGQVPAVVNMGVGKHHGGQRCGIIRKVSIPVVGFLAMPLVKAAIQQNPLAIDSNEVL